jgi:hypothetical protein
MLAINGSFLVCFDGRYALWHVMSSLMKINDPDNYCLILDGLKKIKCC